ncbi:MAG TPA: hypothetical protein VHP33_12165 [Polyangiaceae bacterium]|nr:hypothetical protein [Polyangiaceae bacterium]
MSLFTEAIGRALDQLAAAVERDSLKKPWLLSFNATPAGVFLKAMDVELTSADESAEPIRALEAESSVEELRARFIAAWALMPVLSDHEGRPVSAAYEDSLGVGSNEASAGWSWTAWSNGD